MCSATISGEGWGGARCAAAPRPTVLGRLQQWKIFVMHIMETCKIRALGSFTAR